MHSLLLSLFLAVFIVSASRDICDFGDPRRRNCLEYIRNGHVRFGPAEFSRIGLTTNVCFAFTADDLFDLSKRANSIAPGISLAELLSFGCLYHIASASSANFDMILEPLIADYGRSEQFMQKHSPGFCKHKIIFRGTYLEGFLENFCRSEPT